MSFMPVTIICEYCGGVNTRLLDTGFPNGERFHILCDKCGKGFVCYVNWCDDRHANHPVITTFGHSLKLPKLAEEDILMEA